MPSLFYKVIDSKDLDGFKQTLWTAALAVVSIAVVSVCTYTYTVVYASEAIVCMYVAIAHARMAVYMQLSCMAHPVVVQVSSQPHCNGVWP